MIITVLLGKADKTISTIPKLLAYALKKPEYFILEWRTNELSFHGE